jgi:hypothetical protein
MIVFRFISWWIVLMDYSLGCALWLFMVIEHSHGKWPSYRWFTWVYLLMVIFHGYVSLPEGKWILWSFILKNVCWIIVLGVTLWPSSGLVENPSGRYIGTTNANHPQLNAQVIADSHEWRIWTSCAYHFWGFWFRRYNYPKFGAWPKTPVVRRMLAVQAPLSS